MALDRRQNDLRTRRHLLAAESKCFTGRQTELSGRADALLTKTGGACSRLGAVSGRRNTHHDFHSQLTSSVDIGHPAHSILLRSISLSLLFLRTLQFLLQVLSSQHNPRSSLCHFGSQHAYLEQCNTIQILQNLHCHSPRRIQQGRLPRSLHRSCTISTSTPTVKFSPRTLLQHLSLVK